ncbi:MAG: hypothetical protein HQ572_05995 [Candidatus Omnitrophica bacterium]|nr:hypothetical protein [Candidatus Omnitrophota bacterium]
MRKLITFIVAVAFVVNSTGQGYALRPMASATMDKDEFALRVMTYGKDKKTTAPILKDFADRHGVMVVACSNCGEVLRIRHDATVPSVSHTCCYDCAVKIFPDSAHVFKNSAAEQARKRLFIKEYMATKASSAGDIEALKSVLAQSGLNKQVADHLDTGLATQIKGLLEDDSAGLAQQARSFNAILPSPQPGVKRARAIVKRAKSMLPRLTLATRKQATIDFAPDAQLPEALLVKVRKAITANIRDLKEGEDYHHREGGDLYINVTKVLGAPLEHNGKTIRVIKVKGVAFNAEERLKPFKGLFPLIIQFGAFGESVRQALRREKPEGAMTMDTVEDEFEVTDFACRHNASVAVALGKARFDTLKYEGQNLGALILGIENEQEANFRSAFVELLGSGRHLPDIDQFEVQLEPAKVAANRDRAIALVRRLGREYRQLHNVGVIHQMSNMGNILVAESGNVRLGDFEYSQILRKPTVAQEVAYRVNDIRNVFRSLEAFLRLDIILEQANIHIQREFLTGYLGEETEGDTLRYLSLQDMQNLLQNLTRHPDILWYDPFLTRMRTITRDNKGGDYTLFDLEFDLRPKNPDFKRNAEADIRWALDDPEIFCALSEVLDREGVPENSINKIIIVESSSLSRHSKPKIDRRRQAILINMPPLQDGYMHLLYEKLIGFVDQKPLKAAFNKTEFARMVPEKDLKRALEVARWERFSPDAYDGERSVTVKLAVPIIYNGVRYDSLKIKGTVYKRILQPKREKFTPPGEDSHEIWIPDADEQGKIVLHDQPNPKGGLMAERAQNETEIMALSFTKGHTLHIPLGHGEYEDLTMDGRNMGFFVCLVPQGIVGVRESCYKIIEEGSVGRIGDTTAVATDSAPKMREKVEDMFYQQGRKLREAHDDGIYLAYPHWDNSYSFQNRYYWKDFSEAQDIRRANRYEPERSLAFRLTDISVALQHLRQLPLFADMFAAESWWEKIMLRADRTFLMGYFYDRLYLFDEKYSRLGVSDFVDAMKEGMKRPVCELDHMFMKPLHEVASGQAPVRLRNVPRITSACFYTIPGSTVDRGVREMDGVEAGIERTLRELGIWHFNFVETDGYVEGYHNADTNSAYIFLPRGLAVSDVRSLVRSELEAIREDLRKDGARPVPYANTINPQHTGSVATLLEDGATDKVKDENLGTYIGILPAVGEDEQFEIIQDWSQIPLVNDGNQLTFVEAEGCAKAFLENAMGVNPTKVEYHKGGSFTSVIRCTYNEGGVEKQLAVNVSHAQSGAYKSTRADYENLTFFHKKGLGKYIPRPYKGASMALASRKEQGEVFVFAVEWLDGYNELHITEHLAGSRFLIWVYDPKKGWRWAARQLKRGKLNQAAVLTEQAKAYKPLSEEDSDRVAREIIKIISYYYDIGNKTALANILINNGDFIYKKLPDGSIDVKLVTTRWRKDGVSFQDLLKYLVSYTVLDQETPYLSGDEKKLDRQLHYPVRVFTRHNIFEGVLGGLTERYGQRKALRMLDIKNQVALDEIRSSYVIESNIKASSAGSIDRLEAIFNDPNKPIYQQKKEMQAVFHDYPQIYAKAMNIGGLPPSFQDGDTNVAILEWWKKGVYSLESQRRRRAHKETSLGVEKLQTGAVFAEIDSAA